MPASITEKYKFCIHGQMCIRDSYVVVAGLDEKRELVLLNDPAQRKLLKEDRSEFEQEWQVAPTRHH